MQRCVYLTQSLQELMNSWMKPKAKNYTAANGPAKFLKRVNNLPMILLYQACSLSM